MIDADEGWQPPDLTFEERQPVEDWEDYPYVYADDDLFRETSQDDRIRMSPRYVIMDSDGIREMEYYDGGYHDPLHDPLHLPPPRGRRLNDTTESGLRHVYEYDGDLICETCWLRHEQVISGCTIPKHLKIGPVEWV